MYVHVFHVFNPKIKIKFYTTRLKDMLIVLIMQYGPISLIILLIAEHTLRQLDLKYGNRLMEQSLLLLSLLGLVGR